MTQFATRLGAVADYQEMENLIRDSVSPIWFDGVHALDHGRSACEGRSDGQPEECAHHHGQPTDHAVDDPAGSGCGFVCTLTVLIDERCDGVHLSYNEMTSYLSLYQNVEHQQSPATLDEKIKALLREGRVNDAQNFQRTINETTS